MTYDPDAVICEEGDKECIRVQVEIEKKKALEEIEKQKRCGRWGCPRVPEPPKVEKHLFSFERLIFLEPRSSLPFTISTDKEDY